MAPRKRLHPQLHHKSKNDIEQEKTDGKLVIRHLPMSVILIFSQEVPRQRESKMMKARIIDGQARGIPRHQRDFKRM